MKAKLVAFLRERAAIGDGSPAMLKGGASFAYVFGKVLVFLLLVEALTGTALAAFYSPSTTDAWGSVAYLQDQTSWGWIVRGVHHHGGGAIVIVAGLHLVQTAVAGAYKRPRELVWWLGVVLLLLTLAWAVTGYVLRWDQAGYWANRVEMGIAAESPIIGGTIKDLALGGNDYGNLTLTRFYTLHVIVLPAIVLLLVVGHIWLAKKHGVTRIRDRTTVPRWPDQAVRDALAMALTLAILMGYVISQDGVDLAAPADPANAYDARPLWYFRWLFELRELAGGAEKIVALVVPAIVGGFLVGLPLVDRSPARAPKRRLLWLGALSGMFAAIGALTVMSFARDSGDAELAKRRADATHLASRTRHLAKKYGVPATGAQDLRLAAPMARARMIYERKCQGCHNSPKDRKGPVIVNGHGDRRWLTAFLLNPSGDAFWGRSKLVKTSEIARELDARRPDGEEPGPDDPKDLAMKPVKLEPAELTAVVEFLYAQSGAADADPAKVKAGKSTFENACSDCHSMKEGEASSAGPGLYGIHSRAWYGSYIGNPKMPHHMGELAEMPRFDAELTVVERDLLAEYLVWLRSATLDEYNALDPL